MLLVRQNLGRPATEIGIVAFCGAVFYAYWAYRAGQDASWDLQNYHDYAAYAFLHWRYALDVGMGGFQGYLNPLPYLVPYTLRHMLPPFAAGLTLAVLQSGVVVATWLLSGTLLPTDTRHPRIFRVLATIAGITGAATLSEIGTSFADLPLAILILGGVALLLAADPPQSGAAWRTAWRLAFAGVLAGAAMGLKLTNAIFIVGLAASAALPWPRPLGVLRAIGLVGTGATIGFLGTGGVWAAYMWASLGNPIFPALNKVFQSTSAAYSNYADLRFLPASLWEGLSYPVRIALGLHPTAEVPFMEPRFLIALCLLLALVLAMLLRQWRTTASPTCQERRMARLAVFLLSSMVTWLGVFSIQRYAVVLEVVSGVAAVMAVPYLFRGGTAVVMALSLTIAAIAATQTPDWWRRPWSDPFIANLPPAYAVPAAYVLVAHPIGYWASILPQASRFYTVYASMGLATGGVFQERITSGLENPPNGLIRTLGPDYPMDEAARDGLATYGLVPAKPCQRAGSLWWVDTIACDVKRSGRRPRAASDLAIGEVVDFSWHGSGWIYLAHGWQNASQDGTAIQGGKSELVLHPETAGHPLVLDVVLTGRRTDSSQSARHVSVFQDGLKTVQWHLRLDGQSETKGVCLRYHGPNAVPDTLSLVLEVVKPTLLSGNADLVLRRMSLREAQNSECNS